MEPIGAWAMVEWKNDGVCSTYYFSFGELDEDENVDTFGVHDENIFFYADGAGSMQALTDWANGEDFVVIDYELVTSY